MIDLSKFVSNYKLLNDVTWTKFYICMCVCVCVCVCIKSNIIQLSHDITFRSRLYNQYNFKIEKYNSVKLGKIVRQSLITKLVVT